MQGLEWIFFLKIEPDMQGIHGMMIDIYNALYMSEIIKKVDYRVIAIVLVITPHIVCFISKGHFDMIN